MSLICHNVHIIIPEIVTMVRCHLSVIMFTQLSPRLFERRARYWPFRNIDNRERCHSPTRESTSRTSTVLTTSGMVSANICAFLYAFLCNFYFQKAEYDCVNARSNVAADPTCRFHLIDVNALRAMDTNILSWTRTYTMILNFSWVQTWCFVLGVNNDNTMTPGWYDSNFQNINF